MLFRSIDAAPDAASGPEGPPVGGVAHALPGRAVDRLGVGRVDDHVRAPGAVVHEVREVLAVSFVQVHQVVFGILFIVVVLVLPGGLVDAWSRAGRLLRLTTVGRLR